MLLNPLIEQAAELAAQWHDVTYRKGCWRELPFAQPAEIVAQVPVMAHLTTVALILQRAGWDDSTVAAGFLHDLLEDTNCRGERMDFERLAGAVGEEVARLVRGVTEPKLNEEGHPLPWRDRKVAYLAHLQDCRAEVLAISLADKLHNLWTMNQALALGTDIFTPGPGRRALSAGPTEQRWYYENVLAAAQACEDERLDPLRDEVAAQLHRFLVLTGQEG